MHEQPFGHVMIRKEAALDWHARPQYPLPEKFPGF
jgi:hypothetical protein